MLRGLTDRSKGVTVRLTRPAGALAAAAVLFVCAAPPSHAIVSGTTTASAGGTTVEVTIPDVIYSGPECMDAPVQATFNAVDSFATVHLSAAAPGSNDALSMSLLANDSGTVAETFQICPSVHRPGVYTTTGTLNTSVEAAQFPPTTFIVSRAATRFSALTATVRGRVLTVTGKVLARTGTGDVGGRGVVRIFGFLSKARGGSGTWQSIGQVAPGASGAFRASGATTRRLDGAYIRAILVPANWCTASRSTVKVAVLPVPSKPSMRR